MELLIILIVALIVLGLVYGIDRRLKFAAVIAVAVVAVGLLFVLLV